jgi:hypothetical protein
MGPTRNVPHGDEHVAAAGQSLLDLNLVLSFGHGSANENKGTKTIEKHDMCDSAIKTVEIKQKGSEKNKATHLADRCLSGGHRATR